jgi:hypothetical protein
LALFVGVLPGDTLAVGADAREGGALEGGEGTSGGVSEVSSSAGLGLGGGDDLSSVGEDGLSSSGGDGLSSGGGDDLSSGSCDDLSSGGGDDLSSGGGDGASRSSEGSDSGGVCGFSEPSGVSSSSSSSISDNPKINACPPAFKRQTHLLRIHLGAP